MNPKSPFGVRASMTGFALAVASLAAVPNAMAQPAGQPYYDPVRDVMVTPSLSSSTSATVATPSPRVGYGPSPVVSSPGAVGVTREPLYGTAYGPAAAPPTSRQFYGTSGSAYTPTSTRAIPAPVPGIQSVPESTAGLEQQPTAGISPSPATVSGSAQPLPQPYYDPSRDVMVTPNMSGTVRYIGTTPAQRMAMAHGMSSSFDLVVRNGRLAQGPVTLSVAHGSDVTLVIDSNMSDTLQIDGYNLAAPIVAGSPMILKFVAEQPGRFAYRLGSTGREIGVLEVSQPQPSSRVGMR